MAEEVKTAIEERATLKVAKVAEDIRLLEDESLPRLGVVTNHLSKIEELLEQKAYSEVIDAYYKERPADVFNELQVTVKNLAKEVKDVKTALRTDTDKRVTQIESEISKICDQAREPEEEKGEVRKPVEHQRLQGRPISPVFYVDEKKQVLR